MNPIGPRSVYDEAKRFSEALSMAHRRTLGTDTAILNCLAGVQIQLNQDMAIAFARAVGEYGSVIFIAANIPYKSEIAPLLIVIRLEEFNQLAAAAIGATMLIIAFVMLLIINLLQAWGRRRFGDGN